jgi:SAM-dependent methyltransferase
MSQIQAIDLAVLADFTGMPREECLARLSSYTPSEMGDAWRNADPRTPEEIRRFYAETDLYLWELLAWQGSAAYEPSRQQLERLTQRWPSRTHPRALDYGCGVGTGSLFLAENGYRVTIAEVPGRTLDFAQARLARNGHDVDVIEVEDDVPRLPAASWDLLVCFDVLELVARPGAVARQLVRALVRGGGAGITTGFDLEDDRYPNHLAIGRARYGGPRWEMYLRSLGMRQLEVANYLRTGRLEEVMRYLRYHFWKATGLYVEHIAR